MTLKVGKGEEEKKKKKKTNSTVATQEMINSIT
jgi:hypothetical protein